jgi:hypothetical protein
VLAVTEGTELDEVDRSKECPVGFWGTVGRRAESIREEHGGSLGRVDGGRLQ